MVKLVLEVKAYFGQKYTHIILNNYYNSLGVLTMKNIASPGPIHLTSGSDRYTNNTVKDNQNNSMHSCWD